MEAQGDANGTGKPESAGRARSTELSGGTGFTFEDAAAAYYLSALLSEGYAPGIENRVVSRVAFQQQGFKEPLDDIIVDFRDATGEPARLGLQAKTSLTISAAESNADFREVIQKCWQTYQKDGFRHQIDRFGAVVQDVAKDRARALISLCEMARESLTLDHFSARFLQGGNASAQVKAVRDDVVKLLNERDGRARTEAEVHGFLAHFVLVQLDFLHGAAASAPAVMTQLRHCLAAGHEDRGPTLWKTLCQTVRDSAGKAGEFDRPRLVRALSPLFRLRAAPSLRGDLEKLTALARTWMEDITNDVGGTHLERKALSEELANLLTKSRFVQIRGLPGSGKSVVLRQRLEADLERGPTLFLKADRLDGKGWASFAALNGLSNSPLVDLLVEIDATGSNTLFIDGIDRIEKDEQAIVLDVLRPILQSPLLSNWKVAVSLRDTGLEPLRNWLGELLGPVSVRTLEVGVLREDEAEALAQAKPQLRALLFGPPAVQEIVRRPFFAKILSQAFGSVNSSPSFQPHTEVDLIDNWWVRGGYDTTGQAATARQRALIELASVQARHLSHAVPIRELTPPAIGVIDGLIADGIIRHVKRGHTIRYVHDILFEWSFFHVLSDKGDDWPTEIRNCGEPPAMARVIELLSQYEYTEGKTWTKTLGVVASSKMRAQWTRAWLLGPIGASTFSNNEREFADAATADGFRFMRKALVWFQAEKTTPNVNILASDMPQDQRIRIADALGWPSDWSSWGRFIQFVLARAAAHPVGLYPDIVSVFEVWQNALAGVRNAISSAIVSQCADWLREIDERSPRKTPDEGPRWESFKELGEFRKSLINIVLRSARSMPKPAEEYLRRVLALKDLREERYSEIVVFSPTLAGTHSDLLAELTLRHLKEELPDDHAARERAEFEEIAELRRQIRAKPVAERTKREKAMLTGGFSHAGFQRFSSHDWTRLCIDSDLHNFYPASPLREPFHSLFNSAPEQAIKLITELCNHATTAWRQLHRHIHEERKYGTPTPLVIKFPWGGQEFWGGDREYIWYRGLGAPNALECGLMALEEWCFAELERGRPFDELIRQIVEGNQCVAVLGIAVLLALQTSRLSETVFGLVTSQRLLSADKHRLVQDLSSGNLNLMGFSKKSDLPHAEAIKTANARPVRSRQLSWLVPAYVLSGEFGERARGAIVAFKDNLPFEYEEHRSIQEAKDHFTKEALEYAELADRDNYRARKLPDQEGLVEITHVSPSASLPENVEKAEQAKLYLQQGNIWVWADEAFKSGVVRDPVKMAAAIELARKLDSDSLYSAGDEDENIEMRRAAVAAAAAVVLEFREGRSADELTRARDVLRRAIGGPEQRGGFWSPQSVIPWHPLIFAAHGLGADLRNGTAEDDAPTALLALVAHPLELVSLTALSETARLWQVDPKLEWAALQLALVLCRIEPRPDAEEARGPSDPIHPPARTQEAFDAALKYYEQGKGWPDLPLPPPAWIEAKDRKTRGRGYPDHLDADDLEEPKRNWMEPETHWYSQYAAKVLERIPYEEIVEGEQKAPLLDFVGKVLEWTNAKNAPPWIKKGRRDRESSRLFEWTAELGSIVGHLAGLLPISEARSRFLDAIFALEGESCWAMLAPCVSNYTCRYIYDAKEVPAGAAEFLALCLERFLKSSAFDRNSYYSGEFHGFSEPRLVELLMFVSIEHAALATRFVNGNWSEIKLILPIVDRFVRAGGWSSTVMYHFLTLCERSKATYPAEMFADEIMEVVGDGTKPLKGWHGTSIPARIAGLVQHFANRETPMPLLLGQKLLRVLDLLVDMGDRRSAALQLSECFREIKIA